MRSVAEEKIRVEEGSSAGSVDDLSGHQGMFWARKGQLEKQQ